LVGSGPVAPAFTGAAPHILLPMSLRPTKLSTTVLLLILICAVGGLLRAYKVVEPNPVPGDDAHAYYALAKSLYEDGSFGGPDFNNASDWSPGAPLLYAAMFKLTGGPREGSIRALQALIGIASILVAFMLARRLAGGADGEGGGADTAGLVAAGLVALYPPFIHSTGAAMSETLAIFLLGLVGLTLLWARDGGAERRHRWAAWLLPGFLTGLLCLTRPEYMAVGLVLALIIAWAEADRRILHGILAAVFFLLAMALPILPWTVHNLNTLDRLVPISTGSGKALFTGTFMPGDGDYQRTKAVLARQQLGVDLKPGSPELDEIDPKPLFDRVAERYPELSRDDALGRIGRQQLEENLSERPFDYAAMTARKVWRMWSQGQGGVMRSVPGRIVQVALVVAGLVGLLLLVRRRRWFEAAICAAPIAIITLVGAVTLASDRRGQVLMILLLPLAASALAIFGRDGSDSPGSATVK
jgi:4-amino-4-deoxy-L-arabinose transferase-like glycosyltransferase